MYLQLSVSMYKKLTCKGCRFQYGTLEEPKVDSVDPREDQWLLNNCVKSQMVKGTEDFQDSEPNPCDIVMVAKHLSKSI